VFPFFAVRLGTREGQNYPHRLTAINLNVPCLAEIGWSDHQHRTQHPFNTWIVQVKKWRSTSVKVYGCVIPA
jgi:hypothetical protein